MKMRHSYFRSMLVRLLLLAGIPSLVFSTLFILDEYRSGEVHLEQMSRQIHANIVQSSKEGFLTERVRTYLAPLAESALLNPEMQGVLFKRSDGSVLLWQGRGDRAVQDEMKAFRPPGHELVQGKADIAGRTLFFVSGPVMAWRMKGAAELFGLEKKRSDVALGTVTLFATPDGLMRALRARILQSLAVILVFLLAVSVVAYFMARRITRPVEELIEGFRRLEKGDYSPDLSDPSQYELALLVDQFKQTASRLEALMREKDSYSQQLLATAQELADLNETLEQKIVERTQSLENANEMLELSNRRIQEADRLKSEFLANMSHELRTPLNAVIGFSELLLEKIPGPVTPDQEQCLQDILSAGQHLLMLINEILDLSKVEAGKMPLSYSILDVGSLAAEIQTLFKPILEKKDQELLVDIRQARHKVYTDPHKLKQVLINLLSNAHKFSPVGSRIWLGINRRPGHHVFSVTDEGVGIPEEKQKLVFEAFRQLDGTTSRSQEGTGLGLTLCQRFTELLGGVITLRSTVGRGSTFTVYLPEEPEKALAPSDVLVADDGKGACG